MVIALLLITVSIFLVVDLILRREQKTLEKTRVKAPIFLSPEKALKPIGDRKDRWYHPSHSWVLEGKDTLYYVGIDSFISNLFPMDIRIGDLPDRGTNLEQGVNLWRIMINGRTIQQLSPLTGEVMALNPACRMSIPLPAEKLEESWILQMKSRNFVRDKKNLMNFDHAAKMNNALRDEFLIQAQDSAYLNDGGKIDSRFLKEMSDLEWLSFLKKFFPFQS